jgi:20S proteasome subunit beta 6
MIREDDDDDDARYNYCNSVKMMKRRLQVHRVRRALPFTSILLHVVVAALAATMAAGNKFDPYQLNGGLISAVAGQDYVVIASDTRMIGPGGYDILERNHISSRIWAATDAAVDGYDNPEQPKRQSVISSDGSVALAQHQSRKSPSLAGDTTTTEEALTMQSRQVFASLPPVFIGSAGCNADCEMLKRLVRSDCRAAYYFSESQLQVNQVAMLLGQMLYSRRTFPYYSFCTTAGLEGGEGKVFVYDAIGSSEQVAVASTGTGRELLQPILDRKFRSLVHTETTQTSSRMQALGSIPLTQVDCSKEEAVLILLEGYRAVSEREIGVGDQVAFCVLHRRKDGMYECEVWSAPLKRH